MEEVVEVYAHTHLLVDILHIILLGGVTEQNFFACPLTLRLGDALLLEDLLHDMALAFNVPYLYFGHHGLHFHGGAACAAHQIHPTLLGSSSATLPAMSAFEMHLSADTRTLRFSKM